MDVDVCEAITKEVVEEGDVQKAALDPVALGVAEDEVQGGHEEDVEGDKEEKRVVAARTERVGKEDEDEKATDDLEENTEEEDHPVEESCKILVQGATFQGGVVGGEAPGKTENGGDDGDGLVRLEDRQLPLHAHLDQPDLDLVLRHVVDQARQEKVELDSRLEGGATEEDIRQWCVTAEASLPDGLKGQINGAMKGVVGHFLCVNWKALVCCWVG